MWKEDKKNHIHEFILNGNVKGTIKVDNRKTLSRYTLTINGYTKLYTAKETLDNMKTYLEKTYYKPC